VRVEVVTAMAGTAGAALTMLGTGLYLRDMRHGLTRPHRGSWLVWAVIAVVAAASHGAGGGGWSLVVLCCQAGGTLAVLVAGRRCGTGGFTTANGWMFTLAALGVVGWIVSTDPTTAAACAVVADGTGLLAMLPKAWADPGSETVATYALAALTGLLAAVAVAGWELDLLLYPAYYCLGNGATAAVIALRRRALRRGSGTPSGPRKVSRVGDLRLWAPTGASSRVLVAPVSSDRPHDGGRHAHGLSADRARRAGQVPVVGVAVDLRPQPHRDLGHARPLRTRPRAALPEGPPVPRGSRHPPGSGDGGAR
jgi:hypothetical protein